MKRSTRGGEGASPNRERSTRGGEGASPNGGRSRRKTSKMALCINTGLCWGVAFYSLYTGQGAAVVGSCLALIGALYGSYVGVGHLDYRRLLSCLKQQQEVEHSNQSDFDNP